MVNTEKTENQYNKIQKAKCINLSQRSASQKDRTPGTGVYSYSFLLCRREQNNSGVFTMTEILCDICSPENFFSCKICTVLQKQSNHIRKMNSLQKTLGCRRCIVYFISIQYLIVAVSHNVWFEERIMHITLYSTKNTQVELIVTTGFIQFTK